MNDYLKLLRVYALEAIKEAKIENNVKIEMLMDLKESNLYEIMNFLNTGKMLTNLTEDEQFKIKQNFLNNVDLHEDLIRFIDEGPLFDRFKNFAGRIKTGIKNRYEKIKPGIARFRDKVRNFKERLTGEDMVKDSQEKFRKEQEKYERFSDIQDKLNKNSMEKFKEKTASIRNTPLPKRTPEQSAAIRKRAEEMANKAREGIAKKQEEAKERREALVKKYQGRIPVKRQI